VSKLSSPFNVMTLVLVLVSAAGCGKPGDQAGGTDRARTMASPASTPTPSRPEPNPQPDSAHAMPVAPGATPGRNAPR
jgi:hypothetical protein